MNKDPETSKTRHVQENDVKEFVRNRFRSIKSSSQIKELVSFHASNKYMLMAHDQNELKILGNIVANKEKTKLTKILDEYEVHLENSFKKEPTIKTHSNVIMHIFGFFSNDLNKFEKIQFLKLLEEFKEGKITLGHILSEINPIIAQFNKTYLAGQTYFLLYADTDSGNFFHHE